MTCHGPISFLWIIALLNSLAVPLALKKDGTNKSAMSWPMKCCPPKRYADTLWNIPASSKGFCLDPRDGVWSPLIIHSAPFGRSNLFAGLKGEPINESLQSWNPSYEIVVVHCSRYIIYIYVSYIMYVLLPGSVTASST